MKVYTLLKETFDYWNNCFDCNVKTFSDRESALNYLAFEKETMLNDIYDQIEDLFENAMLSKTEENLEKLYDNGNSPYIYEYANDNDFFRIYIEEWGSIQLSISEQDVMEFKI